MNTHASTTSEDLTVVGLGEVLWDLLPEGRCLGGAPANFAFHANQLGAQGVVASSIGRDDLGEEIMCRLNELGLNTSFVRQNDRPTGTVTVTTDSAGQPTYTIHTDVAWDFLTADDDLLRLARHADAVCFGSLAQRSHPSKQSIQNFIQATSRNCLRVFDINLRQDYFCVETIEAALSISDVLKLNNDELPVITDLLGLPREERDAIRSLFDRYSLRLVALTRGESGSSLYGRERFSDHAGYPPPAIADTVGAGDAFTAALTVGLLRFKDLDRIHDAASQIASFVCSQPGATPTIPNSIKHLLR